MLVATCYLFSEHLNIGMYVTCVRGGGTSTSFVRGRVATGLEN